MERVRWARTIAAMRMEKPKPRTWPQIAKATGMSRAKCQRLYSQLLMDGDPDAPVEPMVWITERLDALRVTMDEASATYTAAPKGSAVQVGALKLFNQASAEILELAAGLGYVPQELGALAAERRMQALFREFADLAQHFDVPDEFLRAVQDLSTRRITGPLVIEAQAVSA